MDRIAALLGRSIFWIGWPFYFIYFRLGQRTRVLVTRGDEVLVVTNRLSDGRWNLPGGGLHRGEDPVAGALRELKEEIGVVLKPADLTLLGVQVYKAHGHRYLYTQFMATVTGDLPLKLQWYEIARVQWVHYSVPTSKNATSDVVLAIQQWRAATAASPSGA